MTNGTGKSGWCLVDVNDHEHCRFDRCTCECHERSEDGTG